MAKVSNPEDENGTLLKIEGIILDRLTSLRNTGTPSMDYQELKDSIGSVTSENFDTSLENLVAQALMQSPDGKNYHITKDGISEYEKRKREGTLF
jgi:hypothetical protein